MNTKLRADAKNDFEKDFFKLMNKLMAIEMKKTRVKMNKTIYLGMSILDITKIIMYEFWHDYIKPKYQDRVKLCYMDTDNFIIHTKAEGFYKYIANDAEKWSDTSNYDEDDKDHFHR